MQNNSMSVIARSTPQPQACEKRGLEHEIRSYSIDSLAIFARSESRQCLNSKSHAKRALTCGLKCLSKLQQQTLTGPHLFCALERSRDHADACAHTPIKLHSARVCDGCSFAGAGRRHVTKHPTGRKPQWTLKD
eukprot:2814242-Amphidinium_carterae.1